MSLSNHGLYGPAAADSPESRDRMQILIIDDDAVVREAFRHMLDVEIHQLVFAETAGRALDYLANNSPDLILLDLVLPDMDGLDALDYIRRLPYMHDVPIVIVTSRTDAETLIMALETGATDFISKPFLPGEILAKIEFAARDPQEQHSLIESVITLDNHLPADTALQKGRKKKFIWHFDAVYLSAIRLLIAVDYPKLQELVDRLHNTLEFFELESLLPLSEKLAEAVAQRSFGSIINQLEALYERLQGLRRNLPS